MWRLTERDKEKALEAFNSGDLTTLALIAVKYGWTGGEFSFDADTGELTSMSPYQNDVDAVPINDMTLRALALSELPKDGPFFILWVQGSNRPPVKIFGSQDDAEAVASSFTRRIKKPVHVMKVVSTVEVQPDPVQIRRYDSVVVE